MHASRNAMSAPPQPALENRRLGRWQRIGGLLLIAGALLWTAKVGVLFLPGEHAEIMPLIVLPAMVCFYLGASALPVPFLRNRPWWALALAVPATLVAFPFVAEAIGNAVGALVPASAHPVLHMEAGSLVFAATIAVLGLALLRTATTSSPADGAYQPSTPQP